MNHPIALRPGDRVLVTRLNYLGDVVLSLSLVDALRAQTPGIEVDYLSRRAGAELLRGDDRFARVFELGDGARHTLATLAALRRRRYRTVIDLYSNPRSAWWSFATGAPVRIGGDRRGRRWLYTHRVRTRARAVTDVFLAYGDAVGVRAPAPRPALAFSPAELSAARERLARHGVTAGTRIGIHPGGKWPVKRWPAEKFAELSGLLRERLGAVVVLFTGPGEADATEQVRAAAGGRVAVLPEMGVREAGAVIASLDAMVACDGGIMHVAAAAGTPTVGIFGSAEPAVWFPYESHGPYRAAFIDVSCRPCHRHVCPLGHTRCLNDLSADDVMRRTEEVIEWSKGNLR